MARRVRSGRAMQYEFQVLEFEMDQPSSRVEMLLNELGSDGWQIVGVVQALLRGRIFLQRLAFVSSDLPARREAVQPYQP